MKRFSLSHAGLIGAALILAGCGGNSDISNTVPPAPVVYSGIVADGYLTGATVFADTNNNGVQDTGELSVSSGSGGTYSLSLPNGTAAVTIVADVPATAIDSDTGTRVAYAYRLTAPPGTSSVINAVTTLIRAMMDSMPGTLQSEAEARLRTSLVLSSSFNLYANYLNPQDDTTQSAAVNATNRADAGRVHRIARVLCYYLGKQQAVITAAFGGQIPAAKRAAVQDLIANDLVAHLSQISALVPASTNFDPSTVVISLPDYSNLSRLQAVLAQHAATIGLSLGQALSEGPLAMYAIQAPDGQVNKFHFAQGTMNLNSTRLVSVSSMIGAAGEVAGSYYRPWSGPGDVDFLSGTFSYNASGTNAGTTSLRDDAGDDFTIRMARTDVSGDQMGHLYADAPLQDPTRPWPAGAIMYTMRVTLGNNFTGVVTDATHLLPGVMPSVFYACEAATATGAPCVIGNLALHFDSSTVSATSGGALSFARADTHTALPLAGSWLYGNVGTYLTIPDAYQPMLQGADTDPLFSLRLGQPAQLVYATKIAGALASANTAAKPGTFSLGWVTAGGSIVDFQVFNQVAAAALEANLKF